MIRAGTALNYMRVVVRPLYERAFPAQPTTDPFNNLFYPLKTLKHDYI